MKWFNLTICKCILDAEGITGNFLVEGTSYGTSHAMAVAHYFGERVEKLHLHVPYLPIEIRKEKGWKLYGADDAMKCQPDWVKSICSCRAFCCISCICCCHKRCPGMFYDENGKKVSDGLKALSTKSSRTWKIFSWFLYWQKWCCLQSKCRKRYGA